jgi:hypothetical protein
MNNKRDENKKILHNNFLNKNRKGLSAIIITLIIVGLSLVAVGIVWGVVSNLLQSSEEQTTSQYDTLFLDMKVEKVALEDDGISVSVSRGSGGGTISGVAITISDGENTKVIKREVSDFEQLEQKTFSITSSEMGDVVFVKSVSVSPLIQNSVGNVLDVLESDYFYSCLAILNSGNSNGDGMYTIDIDGVGSEKPIQVYCDMTTDGGGWTLVWQGLPTQARDLETDGEITNINKKIGFNSMMVCAANFDYCLTDTTSELAFLGKSIPEYFNEVGNKPDLPVPRVYFHDSEGIQDVRLINNRFLYGYGNVWRYFWACVDVSGPTSMFVGQGSGGCPMYSQWDRASVGCISTDYLYCNDATSDTPKDTLLGLSKREYQETKVWIR